jgi:hypothetical protein
VRWHEDTNSSCHPWKCKQDLLTIQMCCSERESWPRLRIQHVEPRGFLMPMLFEIITVSSSGRQWLIPWSGLTFPRADMARNGHFNVGYQISILADEDDIQAQWGKPKNETQLRRDSRAETTWTVDDFANVCLS